MKDIVLSANEERMLNIQKKIKQFTQEKPSNRGMADPSYKSYLAQCSKLYNLDSELNDLYNSDLPAEEISERVSEMEQEVNRLIGTV